MNIKGKNSTTLIIQSYVASSIERQAELDYCVSKNLEIAFDEIILFGDNPLTAAKDPRVVSKPYEHRLTFRSFLQAVSLKQDEEGVCILTNSDIILDTEILDHCASIPPSVLLAISRYEQNGLLAPQPHCSQDTWVLRNQGIRRPLVEAADLPLGTPGCELRFAELMYSSGFTVFNPCLSINNIHFHSAKNVHDDNERHYGAYLFTNPCSLSDVLLQNVSSMGRPVYLRSGSTLQNILGPLSDITV